MPLDEPLVAEVDRSPTFPGTAPQRSLKSLVFRGATWTLAGYAANNLLRLASSMVLSRLLFPEAFGLASLIAVYINALQMFSDIGIGTNIVRSPRSKDPEFLDTAWTVQALRGLVLWGCSVLMAWPVAAVYGQPALVWMIPAAGFSAAVQGLNSAAMSTCTRDLLLGRVVQLEVTVQAVTLAASVAFARVYPSVWALIFGNTVGSLVRLAMSHRFLPGHRHRFRWDPAAVHEVFTFGRWVFLSTLITFFAMTSDRLLLGKLITMKQLGVYALAQTLAMVPREVCDRLANLLAFPVITRVWREPGGRGREKATAVRGVLLLFASLACAPLIGVAQPVVDLVYDPRYHDAGRFLAVMAFGSWLQAVSSSYGIVLLAVGHPKYISLAVGLKTVAFWLLVWPVFHSYGVLGVAVLAALSELGVQAGCSLGVRRDGFPTLRVDLPFHLLVVLSAGACHLACRGLTALTGSSAAAVILLGAGYSGVVALVGYYVYRHHASLFRRPGEAGALS
jgi:O-antigen/teichoic acid export membrane protein